MDRITDTNAVSEALTARSTTTSVDELARRGKKQVKLIRASEIAALITETVYGVVQGVKDLSRQDTEQLVLRSKAEFNDVLSARSTEAASRRALEDELGRLRRELVDQQAWASELGQSLADAERTTGTGDPQTVEWMQRMMADMADMKDRLAQSTMDACSEQSQLGSIDGMDAALDKIASSLDERLDQFGRKMGISPAVDTQDVNLDTLFADDEQSQLESNMEDVQLKKNTGTGIAGNLERLKKLKGTE